MSDILLQTQGLGVSFGGVHAVRDVDFRLERGEIRCLIGPNGAGKSTMFNQISGVDTPTSGQVTLLGQQVAGAGARRIARLGLFAPSSTCACWAA